ncbi:hypothetical protein BH23BAC1_BH23BAC1_30260 [soil metagenome]
MADLEEVEKKSNAHKKSSVKNYFEFGEVFGYFFRKKDPSRPTNFNIRMMHGINKISIIIFLLGILFIILKRLVF